MKKIVVITGANSGIGKAAAIEFAMQGYKVVMACRNIQISQPICNEIRQQTQNMDVTLLELDLSSKKSIYSFCEAYKQKYDTLNILINNAGHFKHGEKSFQQSVDGQELTFSTNVLGPALLISLLIDVMEKSEDPRILNACSTNIKHFFDERRKIDFKAICAPPITGKKYNSYHLYGDSKIGLLMATFVMGQEYKDRGICVNAIMIPATKMSKNTLNKFRSYWRLLAILQNVWIPKAEEVSNAYISICTSDVYAGVTGKLINHRGQIVQAADDTMPFIKIMTSSEVYPIYANDEEASKRVWEICTRYMERCSYDMIP